MKLGWGTARAKRASLSALQSLAISAPEEIGCDRWGHKIRNLTDGPYSTIRPDVQKKFEESPLWRQFEDILLGKGIGEKAPEQAPGEAIEPAKQFLSGLRATESIRLLTASQQQRIDDAERNLNETLAAHEQMREIVDPGEWQPIGPPNANAPTMADEIRSLERDLRKVAIAVLRVLAEVSWSLGSAEPFRARIETDARSILEWILAKVNRRDLPLLDKATIESVITTEVSNWVLKAQREFPPPWKASAMSPAPLAAPSDVLHGRNRAIMMHPASDRVAHIKLPRMAYEFPEDFPRLAKSKFLAKRLRAEQSFEEKKGSIQNFADAEALLRNLVLQVFVAFAEEAHELGMEKHWNAEAFESECLKLLTGYSLRAGLMDHRLITPRGDAEIQDALLSTIESSDEWKKYRRLLQEVADSHAADGSDMAGIRKIQPEENASPLPGGNVHVDLLLKIVAKKQITIETWAADHKFGRTTVFDWKAARQAGGSPTGRVSDTKTAEIEKAIEDDAKTLGLELGLATRTGSD